MDKISTKTALIVFVLLYANITSAANLCDSNCLLSITFPSSGSIEAIEPLTITFGAGGLIDTSGSVTAYLDGETLDLDAGQSISFSAGGSFDIGSGGNITFSSLTITTDGDVFLRATGGEEQVQISAGDELHFTGGSTVEISPSIKIEGGLEIGTGSRLSIAAPGSSDSCEITSTSGTNLSAGVGSPITNSNISTCNDIYTLVLNSSLSVSGAVQITDTNTNTSLGTITLIDNNATNTAGPLTLNGSEENSGAGSLGIYLVLLFSALWAYRLFRKWP